MFEHGLLAPVVALAAWSLLMLIWLYATRIPAMMRMGVKPGQISNDPDAASKLPAWARNVADNYNHLMEQPTIFYATALALQLMGQTWQINVTLAWIYVGLRLLHSLVQATVNIILIRFTIFVASSIVLGMLIFHAAIGVGLVRFSFGH
ncbi:MAG: MAPEG family protein [Proteobacteria bacterium]|nr:MAPEG family protein [Pseudomonadota bacterium]